MAFRLAITGTVSCALACRSSRSWRPAPRFGCSISGSGLLANSAKSSPASRASASWVSSSMTSSSNRDGSTTAAAPAASKASSESIRPVNGEADAIKGPRNGSPR